VKKFIENGNLFRWIIGIASGYGLGLLMGQMYNAGAIAHHEGRVAVNTLPDGSKVVTTVKENSK
jgi:hypothetical protein